jgi:hypothetical protein
VVRHRSGYDRLRDVLDIRGRASEGNAGSPSRSAHLGA